MGKTSWTYRLSKESFVLVSSYKVTNTKDTFYHFHSPFLLITFSGMDNSKLLNFLKHSNKSNILKFSVYLMMPEFRVKADEFNMFY